MVSFLLHSLRRATQRGLTQKPQRSHVKAQHFSVTFVFATHALDNDKNASLFASEALWTPTQDKTRFQSTTLCRNDAPRPPRWLWHLKVQEYLLIFKLLACFLTIWYVSFDLCDCTTSPYDVKLSSINNFNSITNNRWHIWQRKRSPFSNSKVKDNLFQEMRSSTWLEIKALLTTITKMFNLWDDSLFVT